MPEMRRHRIEELDRLLTAGVDDDADRELARLVRLATTVGRQSVVETPSPAFRERLRAELLTLEPRVDTSPAARVRRAAEKARGTARSTLRTAVASAAAASLLGTAGVAAAADAAIPGDVLYGVKTLVESTRLALSDSGVPDGRLHLAFAAERLSELEDGADRLDEQRTIDLLRAMDDHGIAGAEELLTVSVERDGEALRGMVATFVTSQSDRLQAVRARLPIGATPFLDDSLEVLRRIQLQVEALEEAACDCATVPLDPATAPRDDVAVRAPAIRAPEIRIVRPGDGPAAPVTACGCAVPTTVPPRETVTELPPADTDEPTRDDPPVDAPEDETVEPDRGEPDTPADEGVLPDLDLPDPLDDVVDDVDEVVDEVLPDVVQDPLEDEVLDPTEELVDELLGQLPGADPQD